MSVLNEGWLAKSTGGTDKMMEGEKRTAVLRPSKCPASCAWSSWTVGGMKTTGSRQWAESSQRHAHWVPPPASSILSSCHLPAVSEGGSHGRGGTTQVSFRDRRLDSWDIMSYSACHSASYSSSSSPPQEPRLCISKAGCVPAPEGGAVPCVPWWVKTWANEVSLPFYFEK